MNVRSEGTHWTVSDGTKDSYVTRKQVAKKELLALKSRANAAKDVVFVANESGLLCFSCPETPFCVHRDAVESRLSPHIETFDVKTEDVIGARFKEIIDLQGIAANCKVVLKTTPFSATLSGTVDRIHSNQIIRLLCGPMSGGPYSILVTETKGSDSLGQPITGTVEGLAPNSAYYYVVQVTDDEGRIIVQSSENQFSTQSHNPRVVRSKDVKHTAATVVGEADLVSPTQAVQIVYWEEGKEDDQKLLLSSGGQKISSQNVTGTITKLEANKTYYFTIQVYDTINDYILEESFEWWFTTADYVAVAHPAEHVLASSAVIRGSADWLPPTQSIRFSYGKGKKESITESKWEGLDAKGQTASAVLYDLIEDSEYWFKTQIVDNKSKVLYESETQTFKTLPYNVTATNIEPKAGTATVVGTADNLNMFEELQIRVNGEVVASVEGREKVGQNLRISLKDLKSYTEYKCEIVVVKDDKVVASNNTSFTTHGYLPAAIGAVNVRDRTATIMGAADFVPPHYYVKFRWGTKEGEYNKESQLLFGTNETSQSFAFTTFGLTPSTKHFYIIEIIGSDGVTVLDQSDPEEFVTLEARRMRRPS